MRNDLPVTGLVLFQHILVNSVSLTSQPVTMAVRNLSFRLLHLELVHRIVRPARLQSSVTREIFLGRSASYNIDGESYYTQ